MDPNSRFAVFKVWNGRCAWCKQPVEFRNGNIDHVVPQTLKEKPEKLKEVLAYYGLSPTFDLEDFENWAPLHPDCNRRKSDAVYGRAPFIRTLLDDCLKKKTDATREKNKLDLAPSNALLLTTIENAVSNGEISSDVIRQFLLELDTNEVSLALKIQRLIDQNIIPFRHGFNWRVISVDTIHEEAMVQSADGKKGGIIPIHFPIHASYYCSNCGSCGPWNGDKCQSCGAWVPPD